jgi:hypothetical protein
MKNVIKDVIAQGLQQSHYYATFATIQVDEGKNGSGFWTDSLSNVKKQKVCMEDLEHKKKEIIEILGWNNHVRNYVGWKLWGGTPM